MSPAVFDNLKSHRPDLDQVWNALAQEARRHSRRTILNLQSVMQQLQDMPPERVLEAFEFLFSRGELKQAYQVRTPNGALRGQAYDSPDDIPDEVEGEFGAMFRRDDGQIVPVIVEVPNEHHS